MGFDFFAELVELEGVLVWRPDKGIVDVRVGF